MKKIICIICRKNFISYSNNIAKCCSKKCKIENKRRNNIKWYQKHKKEQSKKSLDYYYDNYEKTKKKLRKYKKLHKKELQIKKRDYYQLHKLERIKYSKNYRLLHIKESQEYSKEYTKKHKKEINRYLLIKRKTNINFKLTCYLRHRINMALKGNPKLSTTMKLVGCSIDKLKNHLESKFQPGMSFSNYGKWHIDHIIPCARFDLIKASEQRKCFHYTNLQPLWAKDNFRKNKY